MNEAALGQLPAAQPTNPNAEQVPIEQGARPIPSGQPTEHVSIDDAVERAAAKVAEKNALEAKRVAETVDGKKPAAEVVKDAKDPKAKAAADKAAADKAATDKAAAEKKAAAQPRDKDGKLQSPDPDKRAEKAIDDRRRDEHAKSPHKDAPARFDDGAKKDWELTPESVKGATTRTIRELEDGVKKYKGDADAFDTVREYADNAKKNGTDLKTALSKYTGIDAALQKDLRQGFELLVQNLGLKKQDGSPVSFYDIAMAVAGQRPEARQSHHEATVASLTNEVADLKRQLTGVSENITKQRVSATEDQVREWSSAEGHERFEELAEEITFFLHSGRVDPDLPALQRLEEAYRLAELLHPAPGSDPVDADNDEDDAAQTRSGKPAAQAGGKSISGAPASGSDPVRKKKGPAPSIDEAIARAKQRMGSALR